MIQISARRTRGKEKAAIVAASG